MFRRVGWTGTSHPSSLVKLSWVCHTHITFPPQWHWVPPYVHVVVPKSMTLLFLFLIREHMNTSSSSNTSMRSWKGLFSSAQVINNTTLIVSRHGYPRNMMCSCVIANSAANHRSLLLAQFSKQALRLTSRMQVFLYSTPSRHSVPGITSNDDCFQEILHVHVSTLQLKTPTMVCVSLRTLSFV